MQPSAFSRCALGNSRACTILKIPFRNLPHIDFLFKVILPETKAQYKAYKQNKFNYKFIFCVTIDACFTVKLFKYIFN